MAQVLVIADDLTGSNATGALYARLGLRAVTVGALTQVERYADRVDVLVINTASRHWSPARAHAAVRAAAEAAGDAPLIVKRVDTTLRGNPGSELDAVVDVLAAREPAARIRTLAVPAFPDAGRSTVGGLHLVDGVPLTRTAVARDPFDPVRHSRVAAVLGAQSRRSTGELALDVVERGPDAVAAALRASPAETVVCDATENAHLRTVAVAAARLAVEDRIRWVALDSGPFGAALAGELGLRPEGGAPAPILAVVGSVTDRTRTQLARTETALGARWAELDPAAPDPGAVLAELRAAAGEGATVLGVRVAPDPLTTAGSAARPRRRRAHPPRARRDRPPRGRRAVSRRPLRLRRRCRHGGHLGAGRRRLRHRDRGAAARHRGTPGGRPPRRTALRHEGRSHRRPRRRPRLPGTPARGLHPAHPRPHLEHDLNTAPRKATP